jgi:hypothetical protein
MGVKPGGLLFLLQALLLGHFNALCGASRSCYGFTAQAARAPGQTFNAFICKKNADSVELRTVDIQWHTNIYLGDISSVCLQLCRPEWKRKKFEKPARSAYCLPREFPLEYRGKASGAGTG